MSLYTSPKFISQAAERAVKTAAQTALALLGSGAFDILSVDWASIAAVSAGAAALSILSSIASVPVGPEKDASLV